QLSKNARGEIIKTLIGISADEDITAILNIKSFSDSKENIFIATSRGIVKRVPLIEFERVMQSGKKAIRIDENDGVIDVKITKGNQDLILATRRGKALRIHEDAVRVMGRAARGVTGIKMGNDDELCGLCIVDEETLMVLVTEYGYGKRIDLENFTPHGRGTGGQRYYKYNDEKGEVVSVKQVEKNDDIMAITSRGQIIKIPAEQISLQGKNASGVRVVKINKPDFVVSIARSPRAEN
ncbi:MAG: DNA gyrase subunit A, partial [Spirochaetes bacterium]|nr:DNA gyrase subunit A [Spirochaetota bacterium]